MADRASLGEASGDPRAFPSARCLSGTANLDPSPRSTGNAHSGVGARARSHAPCVLRGTREANAWLTRGQCVSARGKTRNAEVEDDCCATSRPWIRREETTTGVEIGGAQGLPVIESPSIASSAQGRVTPRTRGTGLTRHARMTGYAQKRAPSMGKSSQVPLKRRRASRELWVLKTPG
jgi:hypothetical protein